MGGSSLPAIAVMGDGNQGITAILPVAIIAEALHASEDDTIRALALTNMMTIFVKFFVGRVSNFCLCALAASTWCCFCYYFFKWRQR